MPEARAAGPRPNLEGRQRFPEEAAILRLSGRRCGQRGKAGHQLAKFDRFGEVQLISGR